LATPSPNLANNRSDGLLEHLARVQEETIELERQLSRYDAQPEKKVQALHHLMSFASELSADKAQLEFFWSVLIQYIRRQVRQDSGSNRAKLWADVLHHSLEAKRFISERNANPDLQLTNLMLDLWQAQLKPS